jgi:hypothetical protein
MPPHDDPNFIYQKDVVDMHCPRCNQIVSCYRTVYAKEVLFTCRPRKHHFTYILKNGQNVPGTHGNTGPKGYNEEDQ